LHAVDGWAAALVLAAGDLAAKGGLVSVLLRDTL